MSYQFEQKFWSLLALLFLMTPTASVAQVFQTQRAPAPKHEMRGAWVATVFNIDYPQSPSANPISLKEQYKNLLDQLSELGINAVFVQIRPSGDAFYPSEFAPWSQFLTGRQSKAPLDEFDPLEFMIEETHARAMEFHAWFNPFRVSMNLDTSSFSFDHYALRRPDWVLQYGGKLYLDPGLPQVRDHLVNVVGEVVDNYNIDGVHIDDYFYPYPHQGLPFPDSTSYKFYGHSYKDIGDWRRSNTDALVDALHSRIKGARPSTQFGISPFGVWRNKSPEAPTGSDTRAGVTSYDHIYADVLNWINRGWIDYVTPQLYWHIGFEPADHQKLLQWWSLQARSVQLFTGIAAYKVGDNAEAAWHDASEIPKQIDLTRRNFESQGNVFFSSRSLLNDPLELKDSLRLIYNNKALLPERVSLNIPKPRKPDLLRLRYKEGNVHVRWKTNILDKQTNALPHYYVLYRFRNNATMDFNNSQNILAITPMQQGCDRFEFIDYNTDEDQTYTYVVTAVNRAHGEGPPSDGRKMLQLATKIKRIK